MILIAGIGLGIGLIRTARHGDDQARTDSVRAALRAGELAKADELLDRWHRDGPNNPAAYQASRASAWLKRGRLPEAEAAIRLAEVQGLDPVAVQRLNALFHEACGNIGEAEPGLIAALESSQAPDPECCESLARILLETYRLEPAAIVLDRWARDAPQDPRPWLWMFEIDRRRSATERGIEHLNEAIRREPSREPRLMLARLLVEAHRFEEAQTLLEGLVKEQPDEPESLVLQARCFVALAQPEAAQANLDRALKLDPQHRQGLSELSALELGRNRAEVALTLIDRALRLDPYDPDAHYRRGQALDRLGRRSEADLARSRANQLRSDQADLVAIQKRFNERPDDALRCQIARWMFNHGQEVQGVRWVKTVLAHDPDHAEANGLLASYHEGRGETGLANFFRLQARDASGAASPADRPPVAQGAR